MEANKLEKQNEILNYFSARFIGTIGSEGSQNGVPIWKALSNFDNDWPGKTHIEIMRELECRDPLKLLQKLEDKNKVNLYIDEFGCWRVVIRKNEANSHVLEHIDSAIQRKNCGIKKGHSGNVIPLMYPDVHRAYKRGAITLNEAIDIVNELNGNLQRNNNLRASSSNSSADEPAEEKIEKMTISMPTSQNNINNSNWKQTIQPPIKRKPLFPSPTQSSPRENEQSSTTKSNSINILANQRNEIIDHLMVNKTNEDSAKDHIIYILRNEIKQLKNENSAFKNEIVGLRKENGNLQFENKKLLTENLLWNSQFESIMPNFIQLKENKWNSQQCSMKLIIPAENELILTNSVFKIAIETGRAEIPFFIDLNSLFHSKSLIECYFEVEILPKSSYYSISIGFCDSEFPLNARIGLSSRSIAIWDKMGIEINGKKCFFDNDQNGSFNVGDVVGIGIGHFADNFFSPNANYSLACFATLNGNFLGSVNVPKQFIGFGFQLFPAATLEHSGDSIKANFGKEAFLFNQTQLLQ